MKNNIIEISGITSSDELRNYNIQYPCKEICKSYHITLDENKTNIEQILQVFFKTKVTQWKYIFTHGKYKIFIEGILNIKVLFIDGVYSKDIYSTEVNKVISELLPVENASMGNLKPAIFIEEAFINHLNKKRFSLSALMVICTILDTHNEDINLGANNKNIKIINTEPSIKKTMEKTTEVPIVEKTMKKSTEVPIVEKNMKKSTEVPIEKTMEKSNEKPININVEYDMSLKEQHY